MRLASACAQVRVRNLQTAMTGLSYGAVKDVPDAQLASDLSGSGVHFFRYLAEVFGTNRRQRLSRPPERPPDIRSILMGSNGR